MASDTNTKTTNHSDNYGESSITSGLTLRILAVNVIAPIVLVLGLLYLGQHREGLIRLELERLQDSTLLFANVVAENAINTDTIHSLAAPETERMVAQLGKTLDMPTKLFLTNGQLIDSYTPNDASLPNTHESAFIKQVVMLVKFIVHNVAKFVPNNTQLQPYPFEYLDNFYVFPEMSLALGGRVGISAWETENREIILTAAAPVMVDNEIIGIIQLTQDDQVIEKSMSQVRFDVLTLFLASLSVTIFLSIYLAGLIGRPLKKLALSAEAIRQSKGRQIDLPDMSHRQDEIGELSRALRDMTHALWDRMDSIDRFAADVAHEIKNPLTSLRSAVETLSVVKTAADRKKLLEILQHDVERLDRLISDISSASRLDAELSRDETIIIDLAVFLKNIADGYQAPLQRGKKGNNAIKLDLPEGKDLKVRGNESHLAQIFTNLLNNALSFSPANKPIFVRVSTIRKQIKIEVEDSGPGIPENKLEAIFSRFYTERPSNSEEDNFGKHSGLGLSIAKQILQAHGGKISAENIKDEKGAIKGARFTVTLDAVTSKS